MTHKPIVLMPSYNTGVGLLRRTVEEVLASTETPLLVVIDGSNDGTAEMVQELANDFEKLRVLVKPGNEGKGAAVRSGLEHVAAEGFTHALVMDADGQHPADRIDDFVEVSQRNPQAMILGQPVFDEKVPKERLYGRKLSVWMVGLEVAGSAIGDPLYGFRIYPIGPLLDVMSPRGRSNRYDFDPEVAVRLNWAKVPAVKVDAVVKYLDSEEEGVSHFHYLRDNVRFVMLHVKLLLEAPFRILARCFRSRYRAWGSREIVL